ncbi:hypothetical protein F3Y22_tig00110793pilonHSYRG00135 [Hibiscus syriacus]|uniref:Secreted protein n=1 Tax=Hibiscus syriacus TaxID=106335 RepID=A0A6A2ZPB6_HIBSY|nr:hypothetical protein F3Y22_tig00110793pilonHSYRG00135 [Hibiscus syriacus]
MGSVWLVVMATTWTIRVVATELLEASAARWRGTRVSTAGRWTTWQRRRLAFWNLGGGWADSSSDGFEQKVEQGLLIMNFFFLLQMSSSHYELSLEKLIHQVMDLSKRLNKLFSL